MTRGKTGIVLFLIACGSAQPLSPQVSPVAPVSMPERAIAPVPIPEAPQLGLTPEQLIELLSDDDQTYAMRVKRVRRGALFQEQGGSVSNTPTDEATMATLSVVEVLPQQDPRVLCEGGNARLALYIATDSLAFVALDSATIRTTETSPQAATGPGVYLEPGELLEVFDVAEGAEFQGAAYAGHLWSARGFIRRESVGHVYQPAPSENDGSYDAELPNGATLLDAPLGRALARFEPYPGRQRWLATSLRQEAGHTLIQVSTFGARAIGWVVDADVVPVAASRSTRGYGHGSGGLRNRFEHPVSLPAGTVIYSQENREPFGLVSEAGEFDCVGECESEWINVTIRSCVGPMSAWARRPSP